MIVLSYNKTAPLDKDRIVWYYDGATRDRIQKRKVIMQEFKVQSKAINSLGFDSSTLQVTFQSGGVYRYFKVPQAIVEQMLSSDSIGKYFASNIAGKFLSRRLK